LRKQPGFFHVPEQIGTRFKASAPGRADRGRTAETTMPTRRPVTAIARDGTPRSGTSPPCPPMVAAKDGLALR
jgi:hypothetical protein